MFEIALIATLVLVPLCGIILGVYLLYRYAKKRAAMPKGRHAHAGRAVGPMRSFARANSFRFVSPAKLASGGAFADLDALMIGYFGILGLKALGYSGEVYGTANDKQWLQVSGDEQRIHFDNPVVEASADVRVIRDALFAAKLKQVPVEVVCVFTDKKVQLALPRGTGPVKVKEFKKQLGKDKYLEDSGLDMDAVEAAIRGAIPADGK